jgi:hypothetical protein
LLAHRGIAAWFGLTSLLVKGIAQKRSDLIGAVVFAGSFVLLVSLWPANPTRYFIQPFFELVVEQQSENIGNYKRLVRPNSEEFTNLCNLALTFVFAVMGGALGAYWSRDTKKE